MIPRHVASLLLVVVAFTVACIDMSAPNGPASISDLKLPSPSVIVGDTMRDSAGNAAPLTVIAFDANSMPIGSAIIDFFITDSLPAAAFGPRGLLLGVKIGSVHVLGQVNQLQTPAVVVPVTFRPAKLVTVPPAIQPLVIPLSGDTADKGRTDITMAVRSAEDSASQGIRVVFTLISAPESADPLHPAVYLADRDNGGKPSTLDTTGVGGLASRQLVGVARFLKDTTLLGGRMDSAVVSISASYAGVPLAGSPYRLVVPIQVKLALTPALVPLRRPTTGDILAPLRSQRGKRWARAVVPGILHPAP